MNANTSKLFAILAVVVIAASSLAYVYLSDDGGEGENVGKGETEGGYISFFFYDNYEYDQKSGLLAENTHLANGFWVKGYGDTKTECFKDACERAGIDVVMTGDGLGGWANTTDGNYAHIGWAGGKWTSDIWLGSTETYKVKYMAIGHGRWSGGSGGNPPAPWQTPDDIQWYFGESKEPGTGTGVKFYFYDNYNNDPPAVKSQPYSSQTDRFVADGYWVTGYGGTVADAFRDACKRAFGNNVMIGYNDASGTINRIGNVGSQLHSLMWNGTAWESCNLSELSITSDMYIGIGHGSKSAGGNPPIPWQTPDDMNWGL